MDVYLAAQYSRLEEMRDYATRLNNIKHWVTSSWLSDNRSIITKPVDYNMRNFAYEDINNINRADLVVVFAEDPNNQIDGDRGDRHFELGYALGAGKLTAIIGPRENKFYHLTKVIYFRTFNNFYEWIRLIEPEAGRNQFEETK